MAKPDDPASPASRSRSPLPGLPKRTPPAQPAAAPPQAAPPRPDKNDATMVMSPPPPAPAPAAPIPAPARTAPPSAAPAGSRLPRGGSTAPPAPQPAPQAPAPAPAPQAAPPRRAHHDTLTNVLDEVVMEISAELPTGAVSAPAAGKPAAQGQVAHGVSTAEDLAAVRSVFNDVAVAHVSQVRDVMLELRYGDADPKWIEMTKPALRSLRAMAAQMELLDLCEALDAFCTAVDAAIANRARITEDDKAELLRRYSRLIELIPQAFELDAERDRREPIIIEALLYQVPGVEQPTIQKLFSVGLGRLDALISANAQDVAAVSGLRLELATAIVQQFKAYRASATATVSAPDPAAELRQLGDLLIMMSIQNDDFTRASSEWTDEAQQRKRQLRKERDQTFQQIKVALARLGERDQLQRLEKLSFQDRINTLDRFLSSQQPVRPST